MNRHPDVRNRHGRREYLTWHKAGLTVSLDPHPTTLTLENTYNLGSDSAEEVRLSQFYDQ
jgi:hypothetical protein